MVNIKEPKIFTLQEAKMTLPFVKKIVADILDFQGKINKIDQEMRLIKDLKERREKMIDKKQLTLQISEFQKELDLVGCYLKNLNLGIVGFYGKANNGAIIELCWKFGDVDISYWQEIGNTQLIPLTKLSAY